MRHEEHQIQKAIVDLLRYQLPPDATYWAVPNGGKRAKKTNASGKQYSPEGKRLKDEGVIPGVSDLMVLWGGRLICMEVKKPGEGQTKVQKDWEQTITAAGGLYRVVRSVDDAKTLLDVIGCNRPQRLGKQA